MMHLVCLAGIQFTVAADVTSLKPRLLFSDNGQSRLSGFLTVRKRHCQILRVGLQVSSQEAQPSGRWVEGSAKADRVRGHGTNETRHRVFVLES